MHFNLHLHQGKQNKAVKKSLKTNDHVLYGAATGFGKSVALWDMIGRDMDKGLRVLVLAPRRTLVFQLEQTFTKYRPHVMMGAINRGDRHSGLILSSIQTTNSKLKQDTIMYDDIDKIYIDEVHIGGNFPPVEGTVFDLLYKKYWNSAKWVGMTATPITASGYRLDGWDDTVYKYQTGDLIEMGYLAEYIYKAPASMDTSQLRVDKATQEYKVADVEAAVVDTAAMSSLKKHTLAHYSPGVKGLMFCITIQHAEMVQETLGIDCYVIHSKLTGTQQSKVLAEFKACRTGMLINVAMLTTGYDDPTINLLIIARPIRSIRLAIQVWGRGLRRDGDNKCTILDMCSVHDSCGLPDDYRDFNKVKPQVQETEPVVQSTDKFCESCGTSSPASEWFVTKKIKKKSIIKFDECPACGEFTETITLLKKIKTLKIIHSRKKRLAAMMSDAEGIKPKSYKDRKEVVYDLVSDYTGAKPSMSHFVIRDIKKAKMDAALDYTLYRYDKQHINGAKAWHEVELIWNFAKEENEKA